MPLSGKRNTSNYSGYGTITPLTVQHPTYKYIPPKPVKANNKPNIIQSAEGVIGGAINAVKNEFAPKPAKPLAKIGKITPAELPGGIKLDFTTPNQKQSATPTITKQSLQQQAQSVRETQKILKPIQKQVDITKEQIGSAFTDLMKEGGGIVPNMGQVMPKKEYMTQKAYDQAVKNSKSTDFTKWLNSFAGSTVATAPFILLGGQLVDPILAKIALRVPGGTNILTNALSLMTKAAIRTAPYGTLAGLAPAKNTQERLKNTALGVASASILGLGIAGSDVIASELVGKFGNDAVNFLANKELISKVVTGKATPEEIKQFNILNESGLAAEAARSKEGISINATQPKQGKMWDILRYIFNNHYQPNTTKTEGTTAPTADQAVQQQMDSNLKLLQPGEYKPAEVRKIVLNSELKNTPEGQNLIHQTIQAENQGKNVRITKAETKQITPVAESTTPKKPVYNSAQSRAIQAQFTESLDKLRQTASNEQDLIKGIDAAVSKAETLANGDKTVLAGVRTALNKMMFDFSGHSGNYKQDYAILQSLKDDPMIGDFIKTLEGHVNRISENMLKPSPKLVEKPTSGENLLKPVGTGEVKTSKLAERLSNRLKGMGELPQYKTANMEDQIQKASDLVSKDPQKALDIALGKENAPEGILPAYIFEAVRQNAEDMKDIATITALGNSVPNLSLQGTAAGQFIQSLSVIDPSSPTSLIGNIAKAREAAIKSKFGDKPINKVKSEEKTTVKNEIKKSLPKKNDWQSFIDSIQC